MALHNFTESGLAPAFSVIAEQLDIGQFVHSIIKQPPPRISDKIFTSFEKLPIWYLDYVEFAVMLS